MPTDTAITAFIMYHSFAMTPTLALTDFAFKTGAALSLLHVADIREGPYWMRFFTVLLSVPEADIPMLHISANVKKAVFMVAFIVVIY